MACADLACATPWPAQNSSCLTPFPSLPADVAACALPARSDEAEDMWGAELEQLTQILAQCHLHEDVASAPSSIVQSQPASSAAAGSDVGQWADELLRRLQSCASIDEGRALCTEALISFHRQQASTCCGEVGTCAYAERLQKLQGANKVIVQALRVFSQRQASMQARCRQAEEANVHLAEQLRQCQEQLQASERAKANLQSHLQLMNSSLSEAAIHSRPHGPCN